MESHQIRHTFHGKTTNYLEKKKGNKKGSILEIIHGQSAILKPQEEYASTEDKNIIKVITLKFNVLIRLIVKNNPLAHA